MPNTSAHLRKETFLINVFFLGLIYTLILTALVLIQPDLGTAMVYMPILLSIALIAGVKMRYLIFLIGTVLLILLATILPVWYEQENSSYNITRLFTNQRAVYILLGGIAATMILTGAAFWRTRRKIFLWIFYPAAMVFSALPIATFLRIVLQEYQIMRLLVFINPYIDPRGAGWNTIQSITAVGSGGIFGRGYLKGIQSQYRYLPQQSTDFIFSILAEEWGFIGVLIVFVLFAVIIGRGIYIMSITYDPFAAYIAAGVVGMFCFSFYDKCWNDHRVNANYRYSTVILVVRRISIMDGMYRSGIVNECISSSL